MQPQNYNTGQGGSNSGEPMGPDSVLPSIEMPSLELPKQPASETQSPPDASTGVAPQHGTDDWTSEVQELFLRTAQNPHQRAEEFAELRQRYQQTVLGLRQVGRDV